MGPITAPDPTRGVAAIFNSAIAAPAIATAWQVGLLDELQLAQTVDVRSFAAEHDLHCESTQGLVAALATVDVVKLGLQQGFVTAGTLLHEARRTALLLEHGVPVAQTGALHIAARCGHLETMRLLLQHGADVDETLANWSDWTPMHFAATRGRVGAIKLLEQAGARADLEDRNGKTAAQLLEEFNTA